MRERLVPDPSQQSSIRLAFDLAREVVRQVEEAHPGVDADRLEYAVAGAILGEVERAGLASSPTILAGVSDHAMSVICPQSIPDIRRWTRTASASVKPATASAAARTASPCSSHSS